MSYQTKNALEVIGILLGFFVLSLAVIGIGTYFYFAPSLADKASIMNSNDTGLTLLDDSGKPFFTFYQAKSREYVPLSQVSSYVEHAAVAVEDKDFYTHQGFSLKSIGRSAILDIVHKSFSYGGSTITQQLVKNALLSQEKTLSRKFREIILAQEIERRYSKNEILEMYLNSVYFGQGAFGIEEAAKTYFGKDAADLNLAESSYLVALLPAPSALSENSQPAHARQLTVLQDLKDQHYISASEAASAAAVKLRFNNTSEDINDVAPHFALMVRDALIKKYGEEEVARSGFKVKTTLNIAWQKYAENSVKKHVTALSGDDVTNGAVVVMDPHTGNVKALVGSIDWYDSNFGKVNMAISPRQPGSSFKPFVYGEALQDQLITPATVLADVPTTFKIANCSVNCDYKPKDYDGKFRGPVLVRRALSNSLNIPAVEVMQKVGVDRMLVTAQNLGIDTLGNDDSKYGPSLVLGAGEVPLIEMTRAYSAFAANGQLHKINLYTQIIDKHGNNIHHDGIETSTVWTPEVAFLISSILSDNHARAEEFGNALTISRPAAVKTGTTEDYRDAWTIGYTPDLVVGVWVGNNDNKPMDQVAGSLGAAPIWRDLMGKFTANYAVKSFNPPSDVSRVAICASNGGRIKIATTSAIMEYFISGTEPTKLCGPSNIDFAASPSGEFVSGIGGAPPTDTPQPTVTEASPDQSQ